MVINDDYNNNVYASEEDETSQGNISRTSKLNIFTFGTEGLKK